MSERETFAANLRDYVEESPYSRRQLAERIGLSYNALNRWLQVGLERPDQRTRKPLKKLCRLLGVELEALWVDPVESRAEEYAQKVRDLIEHWERLEVDYQEVAERIEHWSMAAEVAQRFCRDEPDLADVIVKVKSLETEGQLLGYLESLVREWDLDESSAYKRLIETTQRFLVLALPNDPDQLGRWFKEVHPRRWEAMLESNALDHEGELCAFARHMMAEGLSAHEAYEGLLRLASGTAQDDVGPRRFAI